MRMLSLLAAALMGSYSAPEVPIQALKSRAPTPVKRKKKGSRAKAHSYGSNLLAHFNGKGICWSAKPNKLKRHYGDTQFVHGLISGNR